MISNIFDIGQVINKHLITGFEKIVSFVFARIPVFLEAKFTATSRFKGKRNIGFPRSR